MNKKIVVVYSGGLDSTVLLYQAVDLHGKDNVKAITFNYGSRHNKKEIECAKWNTKRLGVEHHIFDLENIIGQHFQSAILKGGENVPHGHYAEENMKKTVVPLRNGIMLLLVGGYADSINFNEVWIASHSGDHHIYLDCRPAFNRLMNLAIEYGTENRVKISAPFNHMYKEDIVSKGHQLAVPFEHTWSCYKGGREPCLKCGTCLERIISFRKANVKDSLLTKEQWKQGLKNAQGMN